MSLEGFSSPAYEPFLTEASNPLHYSKTPLTATPRCNFIDSLIDCIQNSGTNASLIDENDSRSLYLFSNDGLSHLGVSDRFPYLSSLESKGTETIAPFSRAKYPINFPKPVSPLADLMKSWDFQLRSDVLLATTQIPESESLNRGVVVTILNQPIPMLSKNAKEISIGNYRDKKTRRASNNSKKYEFRREVAIKKARIKGRFTKEANVFGVLCSCMKDIS